jgi:tight adherence protein C
MTSMPVDLVVALGAVFLSVALLAGLAASAFLSRPSATQRRIDALAPSLIREGPAVPVSLEGRDPTLARWSMLLPKSAKDMSALERRLASGGYRSTAAVVFFLAAQLVLPVFLGLLVLGAAVFGPFGITKGTGWIAAACAAVAGYFVPGFFLDHQISQRRRQIRNGLPDVLDLLIVCLEAGSSLDQSIAKTSEELAMAYPAISQELRVLATETRAGKPRIEAFKNLAERTKVDDIRALVAMLVQTDRFGTSVVRALRAMADEMRTKRRQIAEETAAKVSVKLVFPLVFFMFPGLFIVMLGPAVLQFLRNFPK